MEIQSHEAESRRGSRIRGIGRTAGLSHADPTIVYLDRWSADRSVGLVGDFLLSIVEIWPLGWSSLFKIPAWRAQVKRTRPSVRSSLPTIGNKMRGLRYLSEWTWEGHETVLKKNVVSKVSSGGISLKRWNDSQVIRVGVNSLSRSAFFTLYCDSNRYLHYYASKRMITNYCDHVSRCRSFIFFRG